MIQEVKQFLTEAKPFTQLWFYCYAAVKVKHLAINKNKSYRGSYKIKAVPDCHPLYVQSYLITYCGDEESDCSLYTGIALAHNYI